MKNILSYKCHIFGTGLFLSYKLKDKLLKNSQTANSCDDDFNLCIFLVSLEIQKILPLGSWGQACKQIIFPFRILL